LKAYVQLWCSAKTGKHGGMKPPPILIAGGGIAGFSAALALRNHDCLMLEQSPAFSPLGAGLQLGPNAVRALQRLGAWDAVEPIASSPPAIHMRDGITGKILKILPLGHYFEKRYGAPYRVAHRADLHHSLLQCASRQPNLTIKLASAVTAVTAHPDHVAVECGSTRYSCQSLIAADGVNSFIRQKMFSNAKAIDSGFTFHRLLTTSNEFHTQDIALECVNVWFYPDGHVVHYPVGKQQQLNMIAITPQGRDIATHFEQACQPLQILLHHMLGNSTQWPGLYAPTLNSWVKHGVMLLGDSAHGTLPFLAQGAAMALEDAACLANVLDTANSLPHAIAETAARRIQRTTRLHQASLRAGRTYHASGMLRQSRNAVLAATPPSWLTAGLDWIYKGD
jgi:salicylate hydroxylase